MTRIGDVFGRRGVSFRRSGAGVQTTPASNSEWKSVVVDDFSGGYDSSGIEERTKPGSSPFMLDMTIDKRGRLEVMPGVAVVESLGHTPTELFSHASLDDFVDVVLIAGSYMGVRSGGATSWYDVGFPSGDGWVACLHAEDLILSNNSFHTDTFVRAKQATEVTQLGWGEAGTLLSFGGRLWAANCNIGGTRNPLGVKWTGSSGYATDISGEGSGFELLLHDTTENDHIVALRELGFDLVVVMLRKNIWIGTPTSDTDHPLDFRPRVFGTGAVNEPSIKSVEGGVMFLSDNGVKFFNGNVVEHKSAQIDEDILPLDYTMLGEYSLTYNASRQELLLHTPTETWIYKTQYDRWERSSLVVHRSLSLFNPLTQSYTSLTAGWSLGWSGFWGDMPPGGINSLFDDTLYLAGDELGRPDSTVMTYFGVPQTPVWQAPQANGPEFDEFIEYDQIELEYEGDATLDLFVCDENGELLRQFVADEVLPTASARRRIRFNNTISGVGLGCKLTLSSASEFTLRRIAARYRIASTRSTTP